MLNTTPICPITSEFLVQMASIPVNTSNPVALKELLFNKYKIEIPVMTLNGNYFIRYSINAYNTQKDLDILFNALQDIITTTDLIEV